MTTARESPGVGQAQDLFDRCWERIKLALKFEHDRFDLESDEFETEGSSSQTLSRAGDPESARPLPATDEAESNEDEPDLTSPRPATENAPVISENPDARLFSGDVRFEIVPSYGWNEGEGVPGWLREVPGLRVISTGGYYGVNRWITTCTVTLDQPAPLLCTLKAMPQAGEVREHDGNILIRLR